MVAAYRHLRVLALLLVITATGWAQSKGPGAAWRSQFALDQPPPSLTIRAQVTEFATSQTRTLVVKVSRGRRKFDFTTADGKHQIFISTNKGAVDVSKGKPRPLPSGDARFSLDFMPFLLPWDEIANAETALDQDGCLRISPDTGHLPYQICLNASQEIGASTKTIKVGTAAQVPSTLRLDYLDYVGTSMRYPSRITVKVNGTAVSEMKILELDPTSAIDPSDLEVGQ